MTDKLDQIINKLHFLESKLVTIEHLLINTKSTDSVKKPTKPKKLKKLKKPTKPPVPKTGCIIIKKYNNASYIIGDTYDKKNIIKKCKGWWTPTIKGWTIRNKYYESLKTSLDKCTMSLTEETFNEDLQIDTISNSPLKSNIHDTFTFLSDSE